MQEQKKMFKFSDIAVPEVNKLTFKLPQCVCKNRITKGLQSSQRDNEQNIENNYVWNM